MPLILDPARYDRATLSRLAEEMILGLEELRPSILSPKARVIDPESLRTARETLEAALEILRRPGERSDEELVLDANLGYATTLALVDLVKSHTELPRVPAPRKGTSG
ncbi:MAG: hypothetical protein WB947_00955 [Thermoplasmata archaeon]